VKEARRLLEGFSKAAVDDVSIATPPPATDDEASDVGTSISYQDSNARLYCYISEIHCRLRHHNSWAYHHSLVLAFKFKLPAYCLPNRPPWHTTLYHGYMEAEGAFGYWVGDTINNNYYLLLWQLTSTNTTMQQITNICNNWQKYDAIYTSSSAPPSLPAPPPPLSNNQPWNNFHHSRCHSQCFWIRNISASRFYNVQKIRLLLSLLRAVRHPTMPQTFAE